MIFDLIINFVEASILCFFLGYYFDIKNRRQYIIVSTLLCFIATTSLNETTTINEFVLLGFIYIIQLVLLRFYDQQINTKTLLIVSVGLLMIIICNIFSLFIFSLFFKIEVSKISMYDLIFQVCIIFSKIFYFLTSICILTQKDKYKISIDIKQWWILLTIELLILLCLFTLGYSLVANNINNITILFILIVLIITAFLIFFLFQKIQIEEEEKTKYLLENQNSKNVLENYKRFNSIKYEVADMEHKMMYTLLHIKESTTDKKIIAIADKYISDISKFSSFITSENPYFDTMICNKLNDLWQNGRNTKISIFINRRELYEQSNFVSLVINMLDFFNELCIYNSDLELIIIEKGEFAILKFIGTVTDKVDIVLNQSIQLLIKDLCAKYSFDYSDDYLTISILVDITNHDESDYKKRN